MGKTGAVIEPPLPAVRAGGLELGLGKSDFSLNAAISIKCFVRR